MLDRYGFEHELANGARGGVYRGREITTGCAVAIKVFADVADGESDENPDPAGQFPGPPRSALNHPDVAALHSHGRKGNLCYVVTAIAPGRDLSAHDRPPRLLPLRTVLGVIARVAGALHHAHRRGVVHGDVKPGNIVFDPRTGAVSLIDFPVTAPRAGTPAYLAPERLCGANATAASDQFALGATLYRLACGSLPFSGRSWPEIAYRVVNAPHVDIRVHAPTVTAALARVIDKALAKDPAERYRSIGGMGRALARELRAHAW